MISALQQAMLLAAAPGTEQLVCTEQLVRAERLVRAMHLLENDVASIIEITEAVLAALPAGDPLRADLEDIRFAARQAFAKTETLVASAVIRPVLRSR